MMWMEQCSTHQTTVIDKKLDQLNTKSEAGLPLLLILPFQRHTGRHPSDDDNTGP
jgi:hypothetical protein